jgi:acetoacetyl-CoA synthetase
MDVAALNDQGQRVVDQEGELVCGKTFPSRPIYFLDDPIKEKINAAYFNRFPGYWHHGDFVKVTQRGGVIAYGRSDATLKPGGVRIGTAEIYREVERLPYVADSICVGRSRDGDVEVLLFVKMNAGESLTPDRIEEIKRTIRSGATPRHVPKLIEAVADIPYTRSGKKVELAVTYMLNNKPVTNLEAIANPDCLQEFEQYK